MRGAYTARRARRCARGRWCPMGGTIHVGQQALRIRQHRWVHTQDVDEALALARYIKVFPDVLTEAMAAISRAAANAATQVGQLFAKLPPGTTVTYDTRPLLRTHGLRLVHNDMTRYPFPPALPPGANPRSTT